ncbi:MAG: ligase-associated DNA damage response DEXH box helicase [Flavobacteriales bacterium]|nr:ligase-associated DNA damage response DEXH box helicase [Flavobacteriales bacterium]
MPKIEGFGLLTKFGGNELHNPLDIQDYGIRQIEDWFDSRNWEPFAFQRESWNHYANGLDGLVNAPTGSGKTYSLLVPALYGATLTSNKGIKVIWITPIRALAKEIKLSADRLIEGMGWDLICSIRTGDTSAADRKKFAKELPDMMITTPETIHVLLSQKEYRKYFKSLESVVVDEWHELLGSKRGVLMELALSHIKSLAPSLRIWGISATIGNLEQARDILLGADRSAHGVTVKAEHRKDIKVKSILPKSVDTMPWTGHLGIKLLEDLLPVIEKSRSVLIFTNTRSQCEIWYNRILEAAPELAGIIAMHHGSMSRDLRYWVEDALYDGRLKAVVCTSSLDLGVDFSPVETIVQIGGPKGVSRFIQRAGRSGHKPGASSEIYFLPTHSLELIEAAALRQAVKDEYHESREPFLLSFDVLVQYLLTRAVSEGFVANEILEEIRTTFCFSDINHEEWEWCLRFITQGGDALQAYPEYRKVEEIDGVYKVTGRAIAMRHRMSIGTIVGDSLLDVRYQRGSSIGNIEESFLSRLSPGEVFWFAGRCLELVRIEGMAAIVKNSSKPKGKIPVWSGGRFPLTSNMSDMLRMKLNEIAQGQIKDVELIRMQPLLDLQRERSAIPGKDELLVEYFESEEGYHLVVFPFEGRLVHEGMAGLVAWRIARESSISFSMAFNDYGFELLSDQPLEVNEDRIAEWLALENLLDDTTAGINESEMARRKFRDIAIISGLVFRGYPGVPVRQRHLQSNAGLIYNVFDQYEVHNLLYRQAHQEVLNQQLEMTRFRNAIWRMQNQRVLITHPPRPTPFAFPIMTDRMREKMSTESVEDMLNKLSLDYS